MQGVKRAPLAVRDAYLLEFVRYPDRRGHLEELYNETKFPAGVAQHWAQIFLAISRLKPSLSVIARPKPSTLLVLAVPARQTSLPKPSLLVIARPKPSLLVIARPKPSLLVIVRPKPSLLVIARPKPSLFVIARLKPSLLVIARPKPSLLVLARPKPSLLDRSSYSPSQTVPVRPSPSRPVPVRHSPSLLERLSQEWPHLLIVRRSDDCD
ncbi:Hypp2719 [Branchiostoma lanceolatum]|uniref:Hypp2719 protein n=1 Tax=Branchiostoma lanceolatum TaxID=7740 RepID=A0A8J9ZYJ3_BRALA|nr:Hypp2719 [Branchiostoma lanceolatum]